MNARAELLTIITRLEVVSHVPAAGLERNAPSAEPNGGKGAIDLEPHEITRLNPTGGNRPRGGIDREDDRQQDFALKSADHYRRRLNGCRTVRDVELVLADARVTLKAWQRPAVKGPDVQPGDPLWKRWVAECDLDDHTLARRFNMNVRHIRRIREEYAA